MPRRFSGGKRSEPQSNTSTVHVKAMRATWLSVARCIAEGRYPEIPEHQQHKLPTLTVPQIIETATKIFLEMGEEKLAATFIRKACAGQYEPLECLCGWQECETILQMKRR
jgi:hypothetical protein